MKVLPNLSFIRNSFYVCMGYYGLAGMLDQDKIIDSSEETVK
jgi:hypothetical protein